MLGDRDIPWRHACHGENLIDIFTCRQSCYQDFGQDEVGSENSTIAI